MSYGYCELDIALCSLIEVVMCKNGDFFLSYKQAIFVETAYTVAFLVLLRSVFLGSMLIFVSSSCILGSMKNRRRRIKSKIIFSYSQV